MKKPLVFLLYIITLLFSAQVTDAQSSKKTFIHPGALHTKKDVQRMRAAIEAGKSPYVEGLEVLLNNPFTDLNCKPRTSETIIRGGPGNNVAHMYIDIHRAYQCTLVAFTPSKAKVSTQVIRVDWGRIFLWRDSSWASLERSKSI